MNGIISNLEVDFLCQAYRLGSPLDITSFASGSRNSSFKLMTKQGEYVLRKLQYKDTQAWWKQKHRQFRVLRHLIETGYPYNVPCYVVDHRGEEICKRDGSYYEVYPMISGMTPADEDIQTGDILNAAKAIALYHKHVADLVIETRRQDDRVWLMAEYRRMQQLHPVDEASALALEHATMFEEILHGFDYERLESVPQVIAHNDMHWKNMLFNDGELTGLLDFENVRRAPKAVDFKCVLQGIRNPSVWDQFFAEYRKHHSLSLQEEALTKDVMVLDACRVFRWAVFGCEKSMAERCFVLRLYADVARTYRGSNDSIHTEAEDTKCRHAVAGRVGPGETHPAYASTVRGMAESLCSVTQRRLDHR